MASVALRIFSPSIRVNSVDITSRADQCQRC
jgi:hypothetical protein